MIQSLCFETVMDDLWLWHWRLCHNSIKTLRKITQKNLVRGIPKINLFKDHLCDASQLGKQTQNSFYSIEDIITTRPLEMLQIDLFGPVSTINSSGKILSIMIIYEFFRYTWVRFLAHKSESFEEFKVFSTWI